jgi:ParB family chromosome partitioning protein
MAEVKDATPREMIAESGFESLELSSLIESKRNIRKVFDPKEQADLVESIKRYGVLSPLIVRPVGNNGKYEIIAGARRFRASGEAGLKEVPCRVVKVENDTALEVIVVDNLQRVNPHPLEEAESFKEILELSDGDIEGLCNKVGKKRPYVMKRLALTSLLDKGKKLYLMGKMTEGHAVLLARLQPNDQKEAIEFLESDDASVGSLKAWIEEELMLEIVKAPWDKADEKLYAKAGPCTTCPKRTSVSKELFDDVKAGDRCTDGACFKIKMKNHIDSIQKTLEKQGHKVYGIWDSYKTKAEAGTLLQGHWLEVKKKTDFCERMAKGIFLEFDKAGQAIDICVVPNNCKIHGRKGLHGDNGTMQEKMWKEMRAQRIDGEVRLRLFKKITEKQGEVEFVDQKIIAEQFFNRLWFGAKVRVCKAMGIEPKVSKFGHKDFETPFIEMLGGVKQSDALGRVLVGLICGADLDPKLDSKNLDDYAERLKIDRKAIEKEVADSFAKKEKKLPKAKDDSKPKKKSGAKKTAKPSSEPQGPDPLEHSDDGDTE